MPRLPMERLQEANARYDELVGLLGTPEVATDAVRIREIGVEQAELEPIVSRFRAYSAIDDELTDTRSLLEGESDPDLMSLAEAELEDLTSRAEAIESELIALLTPADPNDQRDVIVEIRAGTGGDEAGLFAADLYRMYQRYAESNGWSVNLITNHPTGIGGFKEVIFEVEGRGAYSRLKWDSGVHRVQRVPETEASGRIHTSTATVAVLPEADEVDVQVPEHDVRIDVFRSSGPGGQSVNTTDSAVRLTHVPTGLVITCQDEKSQLQNRRKAYQVLRARLNQLEIERQQTEMGEARRSQVGSGERAEKIRTYNFPQNRVTDHRIGLTIHRLDAVLAGELDDLIEPLLAADHERRLADTLTD